MSLIEEVRAVSYPTQDLARDPPRAHVSQTRMAAELGIHRLTLVRWENGEIEPTGENRERYARLLAELRQTVSR